MQWAGWENVDWPEKCFAGDLLVVDVALQASAGCDASRPPAQVRGTWGVISIFMIANVRVTNT